MASNAASPSANSAASPPNLSIVPSTIISRPSLCMKPLPTAISPPASATSPPASLTSKEWIVPPRPKPGRKPATDTPPTKRKAQNRAAQRAFRERRAARVGELEIQIKQIEDDYEQEQDSLKLTVSNLEQEVERYRSELATWIGRCRRLEKELADTKVAAGKPSSGTAATQQSLEPTAEVVGCGNCTLDTRCQCIDDAFDAMTGGGVDREHTRNEKRVTTPNVDAQVKRVKVEPSDNMEIDFTSMYSKPATSANTRHHAVSPSPVVADPCGFCQDGTPCMCAEMAAEQEGVTVPRTGSPAANHVHAPRQLAQFTPPPSEGDVTNPLPSAATACASGPGTCAQCQKDPNSTLFCKALSASRSQSATESSGCCGGKGPDGGCCQSQPRSTRSRTLATNRQLPPLPVSKTSITLTCADAYTTLSRHPAYERASGEIASWMPKLHANPGGSEGRPAMEIDAANVMAVLRDFDRRFGADR